MAARGDEVFALPDFDGAQVGDPPPPPGPVSWTDGAHAHGGHPPRGDSRALTPPRHGGGGSYYDDASPPPPHYDARRAPRGEHSAPAPHSIVHEPSTHKAGPRGGHEGWDSPGSNTPTQSPTHASTQAIFFQQSPTQSPIGGGSGSRGAGIRPPSSAPPAPGAPSGRLSPTRAVEDDVKRLTLLVEDLQRSLQARESRADSVRRGGSDRDMDRRERERERDHYAREQHREALPPPPPLSSTAATTTVPAASALEPRDRDRDRQASLLAAYERERAERDREEEHEREFAPREPTERERQSSAMTTGRVSTRNGDLEPPMSAASAPTPTSPGRPTSRRNSRVSQPSFNTPMQTRTPLTATSHSRTATPQGNTPTGTPKGRRSFYGQQRKESSFGPIPPDPEPQGKVMSQKEFAAMKRSHRTPIKRHESPERVQAWQEQADWRAVEREQAVRVSKGRVAYAGMHAESPVQPHRGRGVERTDKEGRAMSVGKKVGEYSPQGPEGDVRGGQTLNSSAPFDVEKLQDMEKRSRACQPFTSRREFQRAKLNHVLVLDSPGRRKASEVEKQRVLETPMATHMSPERRARKKQKLPSNIPNDAQSILQGAWLSITPPPKQFEIVGDKVYEDGTLLKHEMKVTTRINGGLGVQIADMYITKMTAGEVHWDNGDVWERFGINAQGYDEYNEMLSRQRRAAGSPERRPRTPQAAAQPPRSVGRMPRALPEPEEAHVYSPHHHHHHHPPPPPPPAALAGQGAAIHNYTRENPCPPDLVDPRQTALDAMQNRGDAHSVCPNCNTSLIPGQCTPYCPLTGEQHRFHAPHTSAGRCPSGHRLALQSNYLGNVQCSTCELVLPASRFAGCRVCDYDVCDTCLGCSGEPVEVTLVRSADMGTGAICGPDMLLEEVLPGTPASACGMASLLGRRLTHINSVPVETIHEACDIAQDADTVVMRFV